MQYWRSLVLQVSPRLSAPVVLFTYYNPILERGIDPFLKALKEAGGSGSPFLTESFAFVSWSVPQLWSFPEQQNVTNHKVCVWCFHLIYVFHLSAVLTILVRSIEDDFGTWGWLNFERPEPCSLAIIAMWLYSEQWTYIYSSVNTLICNVCRPAGARCQAWRHR